MLPQYLDLPLRWFANKGMSDKPFAFGWIATV
jgi:hypothetical protein